MRTPWRFPLLLFLLLIGGATLSCRKDAPIPPTPSPIALSIIAPSDGAPFARGQEVKIDCRAHSAAGVSGYSIIVRVGERLVHTFSYDAGMLVDDRNGHYLARETMQFYRTITLSEVGRWRIDASAKAQNGQEESQSVSVIVK